MSAIRIEVMRCTPIVRRSFGIFGLQADGERLSFPLKVELVLSHLKVRLM